VIVSDTQTVMPRPSSLAISIVLPALCSFVFAWDDIGAMRLDIVMSLARGADMFVIGVLRRDGTVDVEVTRELVELAGARRTPFTRHATGSPTSRARWMC
jgi:copper homeostasis protein CutC